MINELAERDTDGFIADRKSSHSRMLIVPHFSRKSELTSPADKKECAQSVGKNNPTCTHEVNVGIINAYCKTHHCNNH